MLSILKRQTVPTDDETKTSGLCTLFLGGGGRERKKTGLLSKDGQNTFQGPWFEPVGSSDAKFCVPDDTTHENFVLISLRKVDVVLQ